MKKPYKTIKFLAMLFVLASFRMGAQALSGVYTIDQTTAASATNFISFNAFATAINTNGVSGPVTVNVVTGTGPYIEQVAFNQIVGASGVNRITINGNNNVITFNSSNTAAGWVVNMNGADYFTFNNLQMNGTGTAAWTLMMNGGANSNIFSACTFSVPANTTSTSQIPVVFSGSNGSYSSAGLSGNDNEFNDCIMFSGYMGISHYGNTSVPYQGGNKFRRCNVTDWYIYGAYLYYSRDVLMKNCVFDRPTRTNFTTTYGVICIYNNGLDLDGNRFQNFWQNGQTNTGTCYGIYGYYNSLASAGTNPNRIRNNIVAKMEFNGAMYGIYYYYPDGEIYNNTLSFDHTASTAGSVTYGIYTYGNATYPVNTRNNMISITRGGSGSKYGIYYGLTGSTVINNNNIYVNSAGGNNNHGYYSSLAANLAAWQTQGCDANGYNLNPTFANITTNDYTPTNASLNNLGAPLGIITDANNMLRNTTTPDIGAIEFLTPLCTGTPSMTVTGPSYALCPGETANFGIGNLSADAGYTFNWFSSTISQVGPWTGVGSTGITYAAPNQTVPAWYSCVISCTAPGGSSIQPVANITIAGTTTSSVTYTESFENIGLNDRLPNCSWFSPNLGATARTYTSALNGNRLPRTGSSYATFNNSSSGNSFYYTNGIQMNPGITYSASLWYQTDFTGATNWSDLSILIGTVQANTGLTSIVSSNGPAVSPVYKSLSGTFTVPNSGLYYVAIRATASNGAAVYLTWDDLKIEIPCTPTLNTPTVTLSSSTSSNVCSGVPVNLTASGASSYVWSTGSTASAITVTPTSNGSYAVTGTSSITGCAATVSQNFSVKPSPVVSIINLPPTSCAGKPVNLIASGANNYVWNTGAIGNVATVSPTANTTYTVVGTNSQGCSSQATQLITVFNNPQVTISALRNTICVGESEQLLASGAVNYQWMSNSIYIQSNPVIVTPNVSTTYTVMGTDNNGCTGTDVINMTVNVCAGLSSNAKQTLVQIFPNPNNGVFNIVLNDVSDASVQVLDITGRVIASYNNVNDTLSVSLENAASGVYYVKINSAKGLVVEKIIKN